MRFFNAPKMGSLTGLLALSLAVPVATSYAQSPSLPDPLEAGWKGASVCEHLYEDAQKRILRCTFPPGVGHERHYHAPHFGYATEGGLMRLTDSKRVREVELATGSSYTSDGVEWHEVLNIGDTTVTYLIVESKPGLAPGSP